MKDRFPISFFPDEMVPVIQEVSYCYRYPIDYLCSAVLSVASSSIGNSCAIRVKDEWVERSSLWIAIVGTAGIAKSHPLSWAMVPIDRREKLLFKEFKERLKDWQQDPNKDNIPQPKLVKMVTTDSTIERTVELLDTNPRGVLIHYDELAGFFNTFQRYNRGNDQEFYLSMWSSKGWTQDRKTSLPVRIDPTTLNINGTIQTSVITEILKGKEESGFADRWLVCNPSDIVKETWTDDVVSDSSVSFYHQAIYKLMDVPMGMDAEGDPYPNVISYCSDAYCVIFDWHRQNTEEINRADIESVKAIRSKMEIYIHRFALIAQMMDYACRPFAPFPECISKIAAERAVLLTNYFLNNMIAMREGSRADTLPDQWKEVYDMLPDYEQEFKLMDFVDTCMMHNMTEKAAKRWFEKHNGKLFKRIKHGVYCKI